MSVIDRLREVSVQCSANTIAVLNRIFEMGLVDESQIWNEVDRQLPNEIAQSLRMACNSLQLITVGEVAELDVQMLIYQLVERLRPSYCGALLFEIVMLKGYAKFIWEDMQYVRLCDKVHKLLSYMHANFQFSLLHPPLFNQVYTNDHRQQIAGIVYEIEREIAITERKCQTGSYYSMTLDGSIDKCVSHVALNQSQIIVQQSVSFKEPKPFIANWIISMSTPQLIFPMLFTTKQTNAQIMYNFQYYNTLEFLLYFPVHRIGMTLIRDNEKYLLYSFLINAAYTIFAFTPFAVPVDVHPTLRTRCGILIPTPVTSEIKVLQDAGIHPLWKLISVTYRNGS